MPEPITTTTLTETRPSWFVRQVMGPMTRVFNPLLGRLAGHRHLAMAARIHHRGRRSGRTFVTPVSARVVGDTVWIPLTFGAGSDWCRNVLAAGGCKIEWRGVAYRADHPVAVDQATALALAGRAFKAPERAMMRLLGIRQFLRLDVVR